MQNISPKTPDAASYYYAADFSTPPSPCRDLTNLINFRVEQSILNVKEEADWQFQMENSLSKLNQVIFADFNDSR